MRPVTEKYHSNSIMSKITELNRSFTNKINDYKHHNDPNFVTLVSDNEKSLSDFNTRKLLMIFAA